jgi:cytidylate kinase
VRRAPALPEVTLCPGTRVIADLHLDPRAPAAGRAFLEWLAGLEAPALLVLGDLFEYWFGPGQARAPGMAELLAALAGRARAGTELHFLHGNRDFLLGPDFARGVAGRVHASGLIGVTPRNERALFLHGDELATRDRAYQRLRAVLRSPPVRACARAAPARLGAALARALRRRSRRALAAKELATVELQESSASAWCRRHGARWLVCGHAHRYRRVRLEDGAQWIVLDAFGGAQDVLRVGADGALVPEASHARLQPASPPLSSRAPMIIALDGPAGVGKSSVARLLARALGCFFLDTGAMYRAVTLAALRAGVAPEDAEGCGRIAAALALDFDAEGRVLLDGQAGEPEIRGPAVTGAVSRVAAHPLVRAAVVARQRAVAAAHEVVVAEGRDTTTVVFPHASHKFYLDASPAERARRRAGQEGTPERKEEIRAELERRDALDTTRANSPLRVARDARVVATDGLSLEDVVARILALMRGAP